MFFIAVISFGVLMSCAGAPYVHNPDLFNRESDVFNKNATDRKEVNVCYAEWRSQSAEVVRLASAECQLTGKLAQLKGRGFFMCPLVSPFAARFVCVISGEQVSKLNR